MGSLERTDVYMILNCGTDRRVIKAVGMSDLERFSSLVQMSITVHFSPPTLHSARALCKNEGGVCAQGREGKAWTWVCACEKDCSFFLVLLGYEITQK